MAGGTVAKPSPLNDNLCWLLTQASHNLVTKLQVALQGMGLSSRAHMVLLAAVDGEFAQIELARMVGLDKTTMVVTIDELEAAGLVERQTSPTDRRARVIAVTAAGRRKLDQAEKVMKATHADALSAVAPEDRAVFLRTLTQLVTGRLSEPAMPAQPVRRRSTR